MTANNGNELSKILVVDDEELLRTMLKAIFRMNGFQVCTAANAADALQLIVHMPFDALLTTLHMPGEGDGFTLLGAMRNMNPDAVTLVHTRYPPLEQVREANLLQSDEILVKPTPLPAIVALVHRKLQKRAQINFSVTESSELEHEFCHPTSKDNYAGEPQCDGNVPSVRND